MRFLSHATIVAAILAPAVALAQPAPNPAAPIAGDWYGTLNVAGGMPVIFRIQPDGSTKVESPKQGPGSMPGEARLETGKVRIVIQTAGATYEGALSPDGKRIDGHWRQGPMSLPLALGRDSAPAVTAAARPQTPKPPFPYSSQEVTFTASGLILAGTLTAPAGKGPFPAAILLTGSGPQDRDSTIFEHKPFLVIADALTRRGVAVLRLDDRGVGGSQAARPGATLDDDASDATAALAWLRARPDIAPDRVGLIGHSLGGSVAMKTAAADPRVAFVALLGAPTIPGDRLVVEQVGAMVRASGAPEAAVQAATAAQAELMRIAAAQTSEAEALAALNALNDRAGAPADAPQRRQLRALVEPHYRSFLRYDPAADLARIRAPVLALVGAKDVQVPAALNLAAARAARATTADTTTQELPGLNHLFQTAGNGMPAEYGEIEETFAPTALATLVEWTATKAKAK